MFTGIVEGTGYVREIRRTGRSERLRIEAPAIVENAGVRAGDSVAVNGVCVTAVAVDSLAFDADLSAETLARTTLGRLAPGTRVNIERPVPAAGRLGGHVVQGHVDGVGRIASLREDAEARWLEITAAPDLARYIVEKGSIAVDGVSLTVTGVRGSRFGVCVIPHTCAVTTLGELGPGCAVNLEVDVLAKYVERLTAGSPATRGGSGRRRAARRDPAEQRTAARSRPAAGRRVAVRRSSRGRR